MKIISKRFLGKYKPGDEIPAGYYDADCLARHVELARVVIVEDAPAADEVVKPARRKKGK